MQFPLFDRVAYGTFSAAHHDVDVALKKRAAISVMALATQVTGLDKGLQVLRQCRQLLNTLTYSTAQISHRQHWRCTLVLHLTTKVPPSPGYPFLFIR